VTKVSAFMKLPRLPTEAPVELSDSDGRLRDELVLEAAAEVRLASSIDSDAKSGSANISESNWLELMMKRKVRNNYQKNYFLSEIDLPIISRRDSFARVSLFLSRKPITL
jgi:hypothetical protein